MKINTVITGVLDENCYILVKNNTCLVIDPGDDYNKIKEIIGENKVLAVLITHAHFDHIGALRNFLTKKSIKVFKRSNVLEKTYIVGDFTFNCIYTPGHSKDSVSYYFEDENNLFSGDVIFKENIGRYDLPGGDKLELIQTLNKLKTYPDNMVIFPGHGNNTTLKHEKENNYMMKNLLEK